MLKVWGLVLLLVVLVGPPLYQVTRMPRSETITQFVVMEKQVVSDVIKYIGSFFSDRR